MAFESAFPEFAIKLGDYPFLDSFDSIDPTVAHVPSLKNRDWKNIILGLFSLKNAKPETKIIIKNNLPHGRKEKKHHHRQFGRSLII